MKTYARAGSAAALSRNGAIYAAAFFLITAGLVAPAGADAQMRSGFLPGIAFSVLQPFEVPKLYLGLDFHYSFLQGVTEPQDKKEFGGYYETYVEIGFYKERSSSFNDGIFFTYCAGINLSFEKFFSYYRSFLVPFFGAKVGGIYINNQGGGVTLEPVIGVVGVLTNYFNINYAASLFLNTVDLAGFIGIHHTIIINFNL
jgi:hypothetical protein